MSVPDTVFVITRQYDEGSPGGAVVDDVFEAAAATQADADAWVEEYVKRTVLMRAEDFTIAEVPVYVKPAAG